MVVGGHVDAGHLGQVGQEQSGLEVAGEGVAVGVLAGVAGGGGGASGEFFGQGDGVAVKGVLAGGQQVRVAKVLPRSVSGMHR
ncbi:hypothetical protein [Streptomyces sp. NPDC056663]|uniref:hypothetical protein n=1 Tax=Streptomyces sp. NPDC056663 TaxID=3345899 RepID=UPI003688EBCC